MKGFSVGDEVVLNDKKIGMAAIVGAKAKVGPREVHTIHGIAGKFLDVIWDRTDNKVNHQNDGGYEIEYFDHIIDVKQVEPEKIDYLEITRQIVGRP